MIHSAAAISHTVHLIATLDKVVVQRLWYIARILITRQSILTNSFTTSLIGSPKSRYLHQLSSAQLSSTERDACTLSIGLEIARMHPVSSTQKGQ